MCPPKHVTGNNLILHNALAWTNTVIYCYYQVRTWVLSIGFTLAYGPMFSKVWTIYRLTLQRKREIRVSGFRFNKI